MTGRKSLMAWYNFAKEEYEYFAEPPGDYKEYIPQSPAAQGLYNLLMEHRGQSSQEAAIHVLDKACGE